jgi:hypothetical protein
MIAQDGHLMQEDTDFAIMGHLRFVISRPFSISMTLSSGFFSVSRYAAIMPLIPPPMMATSYFFTWLPSDLIEYFR